jgi:hypothetical protein
MGGMLSGLLGGGESAGQEAQLASMAASREDIQQYRPEAMQARINALKNASGAYQGANNALQTMYGGAPGAAPGPMAKMQGQFGAMSDSGPKRFMGHDLPAHPQGMVQGGAGGPPTGGPGQPRRPGHQPDALDTAFMMMDPLGIFY